MEIAIKLDPTLDTPLYRQLSNRIEDAIRSGVLKRGDRLPPTRQLSADLNTARRTVVKAYDELLSKGFLEGRVGAGTTVSRNLPMSVTEPTPLMQMSFEPPDPVDFKLSSFGRGLTNREKSLSMAPPTFEFNFGCTPQDLLPVKQWRQVLMRFCNPNQNLAAGDLSDPSGYKPLREAIAQYLTRTKGVICHPDQVMIYCGPHQALNQIIKLLIDPGDIVVVENPGGVKERELLSAHGARLVPIPVDDEGIMFDALSRLPANPKMIYLTPSCQNPTGVLTSLERRNQILGWANDRGVLIVEDALDTDYRYGTPCVASFQGVSTTNAIYFYSLQKVLFPITNISVAIVPPQLVLPFRSANSLLESPGSLIDMYTLTDFIKEGFLDAHVRRTRKVLQERRQILLHSLATSFRQAVWSSARTCGTHVMARFRSEFHESALLSCAEVSKFPMVSMRPNYMYDAPGNEFLISFASLDDAMLRASFEHFAALVAQSESLHYEAEFVDDEEKIDCSPLD